MTNELLVYSGGEVKALPGNRFGGYCVRYTNAMSCDLQGDFFTPATDLELEDRKSLPLYFGHGTDDTLRDRRLGRVSFKQDDTGVWVEGQLDSHDKWLRRIYDLIKEGVLGYSTGAISHLVKRMERQGLAGKVYELLKWPIGEVSLTATPAEPRNNAIALKSFQLQEPSLKEMMRRQTLTESQLLLEESRQLQKMVTDTLSDRPMSAEDWIKHFEWTKQQEQKRNGVTRELQARQSWVEMAAEAKPELEAARALRIQAQELVDRMQRDPAVRRTKRIARTGGRRRR